MSNNNGAKDHNDFPTSAAAMQPNVIGPESFPAQGFMTPGPTDRLRGVEANTDESKGTPYVCPEPTGPEAILDPLGIA